MNQTSWSLGVKSCIRSRRDDARLSTPGQRWRGRLAMAAAIALACAASGPNSPTASAQALPPRAAAAPAPAAPAASAAPQVVNPSTLADAHVQLAQKFVEAAEQILHNGIPGAHQWQQGASLLEAACTLDPAEPSYPRLLAETWRQLGDNEQVIAALNKYRAASKGANWPEDQVVELELIDRYLGRMEAVDQRIKYLREVLGNPSLPPEVKAHAAVLCVPLLAQRSEGEAEGMITQATRLDPLNMPARRLQYQMVARQGSPLERIQVLLAMVRSNPTQRDVLEELARQLSEAGLAQASLDWYSRALLVDQRRGIQPDVDLLLDFAAQSYAAGQFADADQLVNTVIETSPRNPDAWYMRLAFDRSSPDRQAAYTQELEIAKRVFVTQTANVAKKIMGPVKIAGADSGAATKPATQPAVDPTAGVHVDIAGINNDELKTLITRINQGQSPPGMAEAFISAISDIAWFHLYFENAPSEAAPWVAILKAIVPADDVRAVRLQGWLDLTTGQYAQAQAALSGIKDVDPLAMMGIIRMTAQGLIQAPAQPATRPAPATAPAAPGQKPVDEAKNYQKADELARQLMARNRVGLAAAMVRAAYRDRKLEPDARPDAVAIRAELNAPPSLAQWLHIIEAPEQFYLVIGTPVKLPHRLGEPMLATVTIYNKSAFDITVGPEGVISPDLFFDDWLGIQGTRQFPHAAYDRIANVIVLPHGTKSSQIVRLDQGPITAALHDKPSSDVAMFARVTTNPTARGPEIVPGPAGIRRDFQRQFVRTNSAMTTTVQEQQVLAGLTAAAPSERILTLGTLQAHILASRDPDSLGPGAGRALALAPELNDAINNARNDAVPDVAAWATYLAMQLAKPDEKPQLVATLAASHDWEVRLLAGVAAMDLPPKDRKPVAEQLSHDTLPEISLFGGVLQDLAQPTSPPAMETAAPSKHGNEATPATAPSGPALLDGPALGPATQP